MAFEMIKKEGNNVTVQMTVSAESFEKAIQKVYNTTKNRYAIPGFRKGKVPRSIIEKQFGEGVFFEDAINELLPGAYSDAVEALSLDPVAQPDIDVKEISKLDAYLKRLFGNPKIRVVPRPKKDDSAEVYIGEEFIGVMFVDDEDDDRSYQFQMAILDTDLDEDD